MNQFIQIRGAQEHNLKNINLKLPRNNFIVITGVSGSGKSSLAFDTIYAEGQRRYVESLSSYARQFLGQMKKPLIESISGIPPAVAIKQSGPGYNPRSTVGTLTEIYDYLRLLYARLGTPHCFKCGRVIQSQSVSKIAQKIINDGNGKKISILSPLVRGRKGRYRDLFERLRAEGFVTVRIDSKIYSLEEDILLDGRKRHNIAVMVDRLKVSRSDSGRERITDSLEVAMKRSAGLVEIEGLSRDTQIFSKDYGCPVCGISVGEIEPRNFSFNSPYGACSACGGLGVKLEVDESLVVPDGTLSINNGAIKPWGDPITNRFRRWKDAARRYKYQMIDTLSDDMKFSLNTPFNKLSKDVQNVLLYGSDYEYEFILKRGGMTYKKVARFEGAVEELERRYLQSKSNYVKEEIHKLYMRRLTCPDCNGDRLKKESLAVLLCGKNIAESVRMPVLKLQLFLKGIKFSKSEMMVAGKICEEIDSRLSFLINVGVDYISLDRSANTLSSGESERIKLATQIGSSLVGVVYILDEPTVGLHARDVQRLLKSLKELKNMGNTLIVVEHDPETIAASDYVVDLGPGAGSYGGEVVFAGSLKKFKDKGAMKSLTAKYFKGLMEVPAPEKLRKPSEKWIKLRGCKQFNLKNIDVDFPVGLFTCVTGVSGSGKSTLVEEILYKALKKDTLMQGSLRSISGFQYVQRVVNVDQAPIGRTPRSNPATYTDLFAPIRELFARVPHSIARGYTTSRFSFNLKDGSCAECRGQGEIKLEMHFLPDIYIPCKVCGGRRYNDATLDIKYKGKNIYEVLDMTVDEALDFFSKIPKIYNILKTLSDVGLGYIKLGQPSTTLSGGEAQRIKLAKELSKKSTRDTVYILDEPTTGLHQHDIGFLLKVLHSLVELGNTVIVIEHNLDVIKNADWVIDLGPEGGDRGGEVIICTNPLNLVKYPKSYTGRFLRKWKKMGTVPKNLFQK